MKYIYFLIGQILILSLLCCSIGHEDELTEIIQANRNYIDKNYSVKKVDSIRGGNYNTYQTYTIIMNGREFTFDCHAVWQREPRVRKSVIKAANNSSQSPSKYILDSVNCMDNPNMAPQYLDVVCLIDNIEFRIRPNYERVEIDKNEKEVRELIFNLWLNIKDHVEKKKARDT